MSETTCVRGDATAVPVKGAKVIGHRLVAERLVERGIPVTGYDHGEGGR
jgi:hypothetical protein